MSQSIRSIAREKATFGIYQHLTVGSDRDDILTYIGYDGILVEGQSGFKFARRLVDFVLTNEESYIALISKYLKTGWRFERLGQMDQAILLIATAELLETELSPAVIINEAVENAKKYCDENHYRYINGVLSHLVTRGE
ncbi:MAG: transcription antitermination factor NusB [Erysipelotrichaceae bacterium]|nr:transcription antitermination factor NusB [Erysipelotrichaceae bacterium]